MSAAAKSPSLNRLPELDGVRAASILLILATHMLPLGPKAWTLNATAGYMGMSLFFSLSGFLITRFLYKDQTLSTFMQRRIARIAPLLILYAFITAIVMEQNFAGFAVMVLYIQNYTPSLVVPHTIHIWSLCVEFHFYLTIGLAIALFGRRGFWIVPIAALAVMAMKVSTSTFATLQTHLRVDEILAGSMLALVWLNPENRFAKPVIAALSKGFWIFVVLFFLSSHEIGGLFRHLRPYCGAGVVGSIIFMQENWIRQLARLPILKYIATISYALYVWHPLTMAGWLGEGGRWELYLIKRPISFALSFLLAHLSTHTLEKYFTDLARRNTQPKTDPQKA
ncbi:MAG: acyltransferase [Pseudomonadota bacterium]